MGDISQAGIPDATTVSLTDKATGLQSGASKNLQLGLVKQLFDTPVLNSQATGYTLADTDHGTVIEINSSTPVTVTVPAGLRIRFTCIIVQMGTGLITIAAGAGANTRGGSAMGGQYTSAVVMGRALNDFYVFTGGASGTGGSSTQLATPSVTATVISSSEIDLSWSAITGANQYIIKRNSSNTLVGATTLATQTGTTYSNTGLSATTTYYYFVIAHDTTATLTDSNAGTANGTTSGAGVTETPLSATSGLEALSVFYGNFTALEVLNEGAVNKVTVAGTVNKVKFNLHPSVAPPTLLTFFIQVWRAVGDGTYTKIGTVNVPVGGLVMGLNSYTTGAPFAVAVGDFVSIGYTKADTSGTNFFGYSATSTTAAYTTSAPAATGFSWVDGGTAGDTPVQLIQVT